MTLHEALSALAQAAGLPRLSTNAAGVAELVLGGGVVSIYLMAVEEDQIEIAIRLEALRGSDELLDWLLAENGRRRFGRLALEPGGDRVVFCHRLHLAHQTPATLAAAVDRAFREVAALEAGAEQVVRDLRHFAALPVPAEGVLRL